MAKLPLSITILFHPDSEDARELARSLYKYFTDDASGRLDLRIPITYVPDCGDGMPPKNIDLDQAQHSVVVVLVNHRMARRVKNGTGEAWGNFLYNLLHRSKTGSDPHIVLPVALDEGAFELEHRLSKTSFIRLDIEKFRNNDDLKKDELKFRVLVAALYLIQQQEIPDTMLDAPEAPVELFISHAKANLPDIDKAASPKDMGPVYNILLHLSTGPVNHWYDAKKIPPGGRFDEEIQKGILKSSAMICVVTDKYASREWCRREVLEAKKANRPIVVVDALKKGETRNFPYLGNVPTICWHGNPEDSRSIVILSIREALRYLHNMEVLKHYRLETDEVFGTAPELLTVTKLLKDKKDKKDKKRIIYPDLPLGQEELEILYDVHDVELITPLTEIISKFSGLQKATIGLSLSDSSDIRCYGLDKEHLATFADDLSLYLLMAGLRLAYGGRIGHDGEQVDDINYTVKLFSLVRSYSPYAKNLDITMAPIINYVGWPIHLRYTDEDYKQYGQAAILEEIDKPDPLGISEEKLQPDDKGWFPPNSPERRFAWGRGMTSMRMRMTKDITARVVMGGKLEKYVGIYPGVLEEALLMIKAKKPIYLIGMFGGASRLLIDVIEGNKRDELTTDWVCGHIDDFKDALQVYKESGIEFLTPGQIEKKLIEYAKQDLSAILNNGLSNEENRELFYSNNPRRMLELILQGMKNLNTKWDKDHSSC